MNNSVTSLWAGLGRSTRVAAMIVAVLAVSLAIWGSLRLFHEEYGVLFSELAPEDASAIVTQLKKDKVPYRVEDGGATLVVPVERVHDVRLELMSGNVLLSGGVGFEIFDKQGLGATERSQQVSYQRALQGELSRTIGNLDGVKHVRVHLVLPQSSLFTRDRQQASAAVAIALKPQASLQREQIIGVQRLVAAAVAGLDPGRVVITDQSGVTLSTAEPVAGSTGAADARLQVKRDVEEYLTYKVARLLDRAFGAGQAIVSVDATFNFDASKTTIHDLLPGGGSVAGNEGRVVRRRQVTGSSTNEPMWTSAVDGMSPPRTPSSSMEVEYEYGKRIDEVIAAPGAITRLSVGVVVPGAVSAEKRAKIAELVRMAAGVNDARGDAISVQSLASSGEQGEVERSADTSVAADESEAASSSSTTVQLPQWTTAAFGAVALVLVIVGLFWRIRSGRSLSPAERQRILEEIQRSLSEDAPAGRVRP